ncbi:MAG: hypothetical protein R6V62_09075 [Candidatus Fermentibacteraceae bacterium]
MGIETDKQCEPDLPLSDQGCPRLDVIAPGGRDVFMDFAGGVPAPGRGAHPPVNYHGMAAATGGAFHNDPSTVTPDGRAVLVLMPGRADRALAAASALKAAGHPVLATWKECGGHQIRGFFRRPGNEKTFNLLRGLVTAWIASSPAALETLRARVSDAPVLELPTPYPVDLPEWCFGGAEPSSRKGVFIGTREWTVPSRRHGSAMQIAARLVRELPGLTVTVVNRGGTGGLLRTLLVMGRNPAVSLLRPMPYHDYLLRMSGSRIVLQRDESGVPGQVAGDALLAGALCLGGNGMLDGLAFPHMPGAEADDNEVAARALRLLTDDACWSTAVAVSRESGMTRASYSAFRKLWSKARHAIR